MKTKYKFILWMISSILGMIAIMIAKLEIHFVLKNGIPILLGVFSMYLFLSFFDLFELISKDKKIGKRNSVGNGIENNSIKEN